MLVEVRSWRGHTVGERFEGVNNFGVTIGDTYFMDSQMFRAFASAFDLMVIQRDNSFLLMLDHKGWRFSQR